MKLAQKTKYQGEDYWDWSVWIDGTKGELASVRKVRYLLHPTFKPPTQWVEDRSTKFRLDLSGWGEFTIRADVYLSNKEVVRLEHDLQLEYPAAARKKRATSRSKTEATFEQYGEPIETSKWLAIEEGEQFLESLVEGVAGQGGHITFIHGIANKPSAESLLKYWLEALSTDGGVDLKAKGISVSMVYWADVLYAESLVEAMLVEESIPTGGSEGPEQTAEWKRKLSDEERYFVAALESDFQAAAVKASTETEPDDAASAEERIWLPWFIKRPLMERLLRDVHHYLFNVEHTPRPNVTYRVRDEIRGRFVQALNEVTASNPFGKRPHIVVSHSMGTVIAYDCLKRIPECPAVDGFMTVGSPLGLDEIQDMLQPGWTRDNGMPEKVRGNWMNVFDRLDPVCGFDPILGNDFRSNGEQVVNDINEQNYGRWRHSIDKYLGGELLRDALQKLLSAPLTDETPLVGQGRKLPSVVSALTSVPGAEIVSDSRVEAISVSQRPLVGATSSPSDEVVSGVVFIYQLRKSLDSFEHEQVRQLCNGLVERILDRSTVLPLSDAAAILSELRRKRQFALMRKIADALLQSGHESSKIRRLYVQALLDEGDVAAGLNLAESLIAARVDDERELAELEGLIGRGYKQWYVESKNPAWLLRALAAYYPRFEKSPADHLWHGINAVDLLARAEADHIDVSKWPRYRLLAERILSIVSKLNSKGGLQHWDRATAMDACIALGRNEEAARWAREYVHSQGTDAFELASTIRQLREVWLLTPEREPGNLLLPLLNAALLDRDGSVLTLDPSISIATRIDAATQSEQLQKVLGFDEYLPIKWWQAALERCRAVARIETEMGQAVGTGFLVRGSDLDRAFGNELLLLTNAHVVGRKVASESTLADMQAFANFQYSDNTKDHHRRLGAILSSSPYEVLDFTLVAFAGEQPSLEPIQFEASPLTTGTRKRLNAIGYPRGGDLSLSIRDNLLIDFESPFLHYRTPTDPGSSGSPIFDDQWNLVALHHAGSKQMCKLHGEGLYEANEGIWINAIRDVAGGNARSASAGQFSSETLKPAAPAVQVRPSSSVRSPLGEFAVSNPDKELRLRQFMNRIASPDRLENIRIEAPSTMASAMESMATTVPEPTLDAAERAVSKLQNGSPLDGAEMLAMEAIVLPRERPVVFIENDTYSTPESPWEHYITPRIKSHIDRAIPSIGRVELPSNLSIPFGGTAFVVGPDLLMTNRHVAELFASGLGRDVMFRTGQTAAWDYRRERTSPADSGTMLQVRRILMIHPFWDMALIEVDGLTAAHQPLRISVTRPEDLVEREIAVIGYPAKDWRNDSDLQDRIFGRVFNVKRLQPGKIKQREQINSFANQVNAMTHDSSTLGGNSGSAIVDVGTGEVVGLHFAGLYLKANYAVPSYELARDPRVVAAGVNFVDRVAPDPQLDGIWRPFESTGAPLAPVSARPPVFAATSTSVDISLGNVRFSIPVTISGPSSASVVREAAMPGTTLAAEILEGMKSPIVFGRLDHRDGYDPNFLELDGINVPLPTLADAGKKVAARLDDDSFELKYHKFSIVMHKKRRLALFTAANVDWRENVRKVNGRKPTRKELTGLPDGTSEKWFTDERIPENQQLPDVFFTKDGKAFDKGHLVRRDDVCWGMSFKDIQKANGDTYHTTNCSPQVAGFNQSAQGEDNWGDLENLVQSETGAEKVILFSGPVLDDDDLRFDGVDERGEVQIQIPSKFWKIVVAKGDDGPAAFGFMLEQDLSDVPLEFAVPTRWRRYMKTIAEIESLLFGLISLEHLKSFDQAASHRGRRLQARSNR